MSFDVAHPVPKDGYGQYTATTCWHACYRMMHAWKGAAESAIETRLAKAGLKLAELRRRGLDGDEYPAAGSALGLCGWRGQWVREQSDTMLAHLLKGYGPLWLACDWFGEPGAGHAVLITGYSERSRTFKVYNPYSRVMAGQVELEYLTGDKIRKWIHPIRWALQAWY